MRLITLIAFLVLAAPSFAGEAPAASSSADDLATDCLLETGQLRVALAQARRELTRAQTRIGDLEKRLAEAKKPN